MQRTIITAFIMFCLIFSISTSVNADNIFTKPFSIFSYKDDEQENTEEEVKECVEPDGTEKIKETQEPTQREGLNAQVEKNKKVKKQCPSLKVYDQNNPLGVAYMENVLDKAEFYIEEEDFESAKESIDLISEWVYDATEYHTDLFKTLKKLENSNAQADIERKLAIQFAVLRDKALFLEAQVLLNNGEKMQAVENLVEVVRSQPTTDLGFKAYETLQEIGFTYKIEYRVIEDQTKQ